MALLLCVVWVEPGHGSPRVPPAAQGNYRIEFRGALTGSGTAAVSASSITLSGTVRDQSGNTSTFSATILQINKSRFSGSGTAMGLPVKVSGRVDPASDVLRASRLACTFETSRGQFGRILGIRR